MLRALDFDQDWLKVDTDEGQIEVRSLFQAVDDVIGPMVKRVSVKGLKGPIGPLKFVDIEMAS